MREMEISTRTPLSETRTQGVGYTSTSGQAESQAQMLSGPGMTNPMNTPTDLKTFGGFSAAFQNNTPSKHRSPLPALVLSPGQDLLSPNDDQSERARLRAARIAQRRRSVAPDFGSSETDSAPSQSGEDANILNIDALSSMLQNCLKMAAANKINQGNTWDLHLIDHLSELVRNDTDDGAQTNFQLASCTLETGVKIYSFRVDSVHSGTYKLLGGLNRSAHEQAAPELQNEGEDGEGLSPKPTTTAANKKGGTDTLTNYEAITLKKFNESCNVDPLFHQVSAQFDEGGARGLLLVNLSVYPGCEIVFQSSEKPEISMKAEAAKVEDGSGTLDLSFLKDQIEGILDALYEVPQMTPTLKEIVKLIDDPHREAFESEVGRACPPYRNPDASTPTWSCFDSAEDCDPGEVLDEQNDPFTDVNSGSCNVASPASVSWSENTGVQDQEDIDYEGNGLDDELLCEDGLGWLAMASGIPAKSNAWAGPDHWKFPKVKEESKSSESNNQKQEKSTKRKKKVPFSHDFEIGRVPEFELSENYRPTRMPQRTIPLDSILPDDYHYMAPNLGKHMHMHNRSSIRTRSRREPEQVPSGEYFEDVHEETKWDDFEHEPLGAEEDDRGHSDVEDPMGVDLVPPPRKVQQIEVTFDKRAKQVDVRLLKQSLWEQLEHASADSDQEEENTESGLSFQQVLRCFPEDCPAAAPEDISVHLCFICLLHLANEHCLRIDDCSTMDDLRIFQVHEDSKVVA